MPNQRRLSCSMRRADCVPGRFGWCISYVYYSKTFGGVFSFQQNFYSVGEWAISCFSPQSGFVDTMTREGRCLEGGFCEAFWFQLPGNTAILSIEVCIMGYPFRFLCDRHYHFSFLSSTRMLLFASSQVRSAPAPK